MWCSCWQHLTTFPGGWMLVNVIPWERVLMWALMLGSPKKNLGKHYKYNMCLPLSTSCIWFMCSSSAHVLGFWNKMVTTDMHPPLRSETKRTQTLQRSGWNSLVIWPLVGGAMCPSWKMMEFVNGKDDIPYMTWKNKSSPPTSGTSHHKPTIYDWNQPDQECRVHWVHRTGTSWIVGLKQLNVIVKPNLQTREYWSYIWFCERAKLYGSNSHSLGIGSPLTISTIIREYPTESNRVLNDNQTHCPPVICWSLLWKLWPI